MTKLAAPLAFLAFLLAGCGGDEGGLALLDTASQKTGDAESFRQEVTMDSDLDGQTITMDGEGTFTSDQKRGEMSATMEQDGQTIEFDAVMIDGVMYLKGDDFGLPEGKEWLKTPNPPTSSMAPSEFVDFLKDSGEVEEVGTEEIRGEETTHFRGPVDLQALAEESGPAVLQQLRNSPEADRMNMIIDIWVDEEGLPARMALDITADGVEGSMKMTSELLEYDVPVEVSPPPADKVVEAGEIGSSS